VLLMETAMKIHRLVLVEGRSIRSVSKSTGISRNSIRKHLHDKPFITLTKKSDDIVSGKDSSPAWLISVIVFFERVT
jgi:hypothetical protein